MTAAESASSQLLALTGKWQRNIISTVSCRLQIPSLVCWQGPVEIDARRSPPLGADHLPSASTRTLFMDDSTNEGSPRLIQLDYKTRHVVVEWNNVYRVSNAALDFEDTVRRVLNLRENDDLEFYTGWEPGERFKIYRDMWPLLEDYIRSIQVSVTPAVSMRLSRARNWDGHITPGREFVYIVTLTGKYFPVYINLETTRLDDVKEMIAGQEGIPPDQQRLIWKRRQLEDGRLLSEYRDFRSGDTLHLVLRLRGGQDWGYLFRERKKTLHTLPPAQPLPPSQFVQPNLICINYQQRRVLTSWNADYKAFEANARQLLGITTEQLVILSIQLAIFGDGKMEIDPATWPHMQGLISHIWVSDIQSPGPNPASSVAEPGPSSSAHGPSDPTAVASNSDSPAPGSTSLAVPIQSTPIYAAAIQEQDSVQAPLHPSSNANGSLQRSEAVVAKSSAPASPPKLAPTQPSIFQRVLRVLLCRGGS